MPFWTAAGATGQDPKRESRFKVSIGALSDTANGDTVWYAKTFSKPQATVKGVKHRFLNHTFNYPGSVEWADCTVEFIDPTDPVDGAGSIAYLLESMGYQIPKDGKDLINISKRKSVGSLGAVSVSSIDDMGEAIETWTLEQPWVTKFEWGSYKYAGDELLSLKLTFTYDWATCEIFEGEGKTVNGNVALTQAVASTKNKFFENKPT